MYLSKNVVFFSSPFFWGGDHREGSGVHTWSKNSKLTLISGLVSADKSADASADALAIINIG